MELTEIPASCSLFFAGLRLQLQRSWLSITMTVPSAGTPCRLRGNCPVDIFSTSRSFAKGHMGLVFCPGACGCFLCWGLRPALAKEWGRSLRLAVVLVLSGMGSWACLPYSSASCLHGRTAPHSQAAILVSGCVSYLHVPSPFKFCDIANAPVRLKGVGGPLLSNSSFPILTLVRIYISAFCTCPKAT